MEGKALASKTKGQPDQQVREWKKDLGLREEREIRHYDIESERKTALLAKSGDDKRVENDEADASNHGGQGLDRAYR